MNDNFQRCSKAEPCILLVVEDDGDQAEMLKRLLEDYDGRFSVTLARSVAEAAAVLSTRPIDLILLDLNLDENSRGLETLDQIKPLAQDLPIVIVTAQDDRETAMAALDHGARQYFIKPINIENLVISIPYIITNHRNYRELQEICAQLNARVDSITIMRQSLESVASGTDELTGEIRAIVDRLERQTRRRMKMGV
jgi:DNA-binding response OmpR family regulator